MVLLLRHHYSVEHNHLDQNHNYDHNPGLCDKHSCCRIICQRDNSNHVILHATSCYRTLCWSYCDTNNVPFGNPWYYDLFDNP